MCSSYENRGRAAAEARATVSSPRLSISHQNSSDCRSVLTCRHVVCDVYAHLQHVVGQLRSFVSRVSFSRIYGRNRKRCELSLDVATRHQTDDCCGAERRVEDRLRDCSFREDVTRRRRQEGLRQLVLPIDRSFTYRRTPIACMRARHTADVDRTEQCARHGEQWMFADARWR